MSDLDPTHSADHAQGAYEGGFDAVDNNDDHHEENQFDAEQSHLPEGVNFDVEPSENALAKEDEMGDEHAGK